MRLHRKVWIPVAVIAICAWAGATMPRDHVPGPCADVSTDGPQFKCLLESNGGSLP